MKHVKEIISGYLGAFLKEASGVREAQDAEYLHRMRVASRRLRTALWVFKAILPKHNLKECRTLVKDATRGLGTGRDLDVQIAFLEALNRRAKIDSEKKELGEIISILSAKRNRFQHNIIQVLDRLEEQNLRKKIEDNIRSLSLLHDKKQLYIIGHKKIFKRLEDLLAFSAYATNPGRVRKLHQMRIAAKRLRYTLEVFAPVYGPDMDKFIIAAKRAQELLGRFHDSYAWKQSIINLTLKSSKANQLKGALEYVSRELAAIHFKAYDEFLNFWNNTQRNKIWFKLLKLIDSFQHDR